MATITIPEHLQKPHDHPAEWLFRRIWNRCNRDNEHFMGVVVGREGSGKSHTAMRIAAVVDPTFTAGRVMFDVLDLLKTLKSGDHNPGQFYVLDEAGVAMGRRTWHERGQILTNQALQLIRSHNLGLIFTLPRLGELDSQTQGRLQAFLELTDKVPEEHVEGKWKWLDPDRSDQTGKIYRKFPRRREDGETIYYTSVALRPPAERLVEPYERRKAEFQEQFYEKVIGELEGEEAEEGGSDPVGHAVDAITGGNLEAVVDTHGNTGKPYISKVLIRHVYGLSHSDARTVKKLVERELDVSGDADK